MARLRQRFFISPLVLVRDHWRPVVDLLDVAWSWLADLGERRLVQVYAKADVLARLARDRRLQALEGEPHDLLQELTHRPGGAGLLRDALARTPDLTEAARAALAAAPSHDHGDPHEIPPRRPAAGRPRSR